MSTPRSFEGRSLICPIEAITMKSLPRYLLIVFALAGDSTITRFFAITSQVQPRTDVCSMTGGCLPQVFSRLRQAGLKITLTVPEKPNRPKEHAKCSPYSKGPGPGEFWVRGSARRREPAFSPTFVAQNTSPAARELVPAFPKRAARWLAE